MNSLSIHPAHCCGDCSQGAGPSQSFDEVVISQPVNKRRPKRVKNSINWTTKVLMAASLFSTVLASSNDIPVKRRRMEIRDTTNGQPQSLASLVKRRKEWLDNDYTAAANQQSFNINVTPPQACEQMQVTWSTLGGSAPFTIFIGFDDWYSYSTVIPASYADSDVTTWLYDFNVPNFIDIGISKATPEMFVIVGDSSGKLLNTSSFQTVQQNSTNCPLASVPLDFTFYTSPNSNVCTDIQVTWLSMSNTTITYKSPMDLYLVPQEQPPIHVSITNVTAGTMNTTLAVSPGTPYMFAMTDQNGIGGVSGYNIVGLNEYVTQDCLTQVSNSHFLPSATATLASTVRMPDYTGVVSSLVTSNGVVSTATSVQVIEDGSFQGSGLSAGQIAGLTVGCAIGAGLIAALISWFIWRKRHGRKTFSWDLPRGMDGEIEKSNLNAPIDRNYLQSINSPPSSVNNSNRNTALTALSPPQSESSEERERNRGTIYSDTSSRILINTNQGSGTWNSASQRYNSVPSTDQPDSPTGSGSGSNNGSNALRTASVSGSSAGGNPQYVPNSSARSYNRQEEGTSSLPLIDTRRLGNNGSSYNGASNSPNSSNGGEHQRNSIRYPFSPPSRDSTYLTGNSSPRASGTTQQQILQHSDAGLLMDDSLDDEEMMGRIELPPSYHQISRPGNRDSAPRRSSRLRESDTTMTGTQATREENEDDREFWLTDGTNNT